MVLWFLDWVLFLAYPYLFEIKGSVVVESTITHGFLLIYDKNSSIISIHFRGTPIWINGKIVSTYKGKFEIKMEILCQADQLK
jgi:hypothetical protein